MALWTPEQITTELWLDASDSSTITGSPNVSNWADKSGNSNDASQSTPALQPTVATASQNGLDTLSFNADYFNMAGGTSGWNFLHDGSESSFFIIFSPGTTPNPVTAYSLFGNNGGASGNIGAAVWWDDQAVNESIRHYVSKGTSGTPLIDNSSSAGLSPVQTFQLLRVFTDGDNGTAAERSAIAVNAGTEDKNNTSSSSPPSSANATYSMQLGSVGNAIIPFVGEFAEIVMINGSMSLSDQQKMEGYLAWKWGVEGDLPSDHPYKDAAPTLPVTTASSALASSGGPIPTIPTIRNLIDLEYDLMFSVRSLIDLVYGLKLAKLIELPYGDLTQLKKIINFEYGDLTPLRKLINLPYGDLSQIRTLIELPYDIQKQIRKLIDLRYHIIEEEIRTLIDLNYDLQSRDHLRKIIEIIYAIASGVSLEQTSSISVENTLSDTQPNLDALNPFHINVEKDESDPCIRAEIRSNVQSDYTLNPEGSEIRVTINSDVYIVLVEEREATSAISQDGTEIIDTFTLKMASPCMLLDNPYADLISEELYGMASDIAAYVVAKEPDFTYGLEWNIIDWYIPPGVFSVSDATPIAILETLASAGGGIRQSKKDGTLEIRYEFLVNIPDYETDTPEIYLTDQENFYSVNSVTERYKDENNFLIGNEETDTSTLDISYEDISAYSKEARVFQVPWNDDTIRLNTSALTGVTIQENGVASLLIEDEEVEIVDGGGSLSLPIYELASSSYSDTNLGAITFDEDGTITTSTKENSIVIITYYTKFHKFTVSNDDIENVQFWPEII